MDTESTYAVVREFAGSWMLVFMMAFFIGAVLFAFRPGSGRQHRDTANMIFRNEHAPAADQQGPEEGR
jgi:cytochrome c oxidase cbb3-type subunit 4